MAARPILYIIAGSNGAGKTTFATEYLPRFVGKVDFINADLIARGLSPFRPETVAIEAGRMALERVEGFVQRRASFALETTLSGRSYVRTFSRMRAMGYRIEIYFLWVPSPRVALARIKSRVRHGGHSIPPDSVRRRFGRTLWNAFNLYFPLADYVAIVDNSGSEPRTIAEANQGKLIPRDAAVLKRMQNQARRHEA